MLNPKTEILENLFNEARNGKASSLDDFFEKFWEDGVVLPAKEMVSLTDKVYEWLKTIRLQQPLNFAKITLALGYSSFVEGRYEKSLQECMEAQRLFHELKNEDGVQACNALIASNYRSIGELELSVKYNLEAHSYLSKTEAYKVFHAFCTYSLAEVYNETNQLADAIRYYLLAFPIAEALGNEFMSARGHVGIAVVYQRQKKYALALESFTKALHLCDRPNGLAVKARILTDMGMYYYEIGDYETAINFQQQALAIREELKIANAPITNLMNLGEIYRKQGRFDEALTMLDRGLLLAEELKVKMKMYQIHKLLSDIYLAKGETGKCLFHHKAFHEIKEEVQHEDYERKIKNLHLVFEAEQTKKENIIIKKQKQEIENKNQQLQETIDELTITKVSRKAKVFTLFIGIALIIVEEPIFNIVLKHVGEENLFLNITAKVVIILSLKPIDQAIERYLLRRVILKKRKNLFQENQNDQIQTISS